MKVTIAICTWNRARLLRRTLESISGLFVPLGINWELIVVDNNSTDDSRSVIESFSDSLPLKYRFEKRQGHSFSRNTAVKHTTGDLIIWTDNDVVVESDWLQNYVDACRNYPDSSFFGGRITPVFESPKPEWLEQTWEICKPVFAFRDLGDSDFPLNPEQFPYGANLAVRTSVQKAHLFNTDTGRKANDLVGDDEITMLRSLTDAGHHGVWVGNVGVQHIIPDDRATESYVANYFIGQGQMNVQNGRASMRSKWNAYLTAKYNQLCYRLKRKSRTPDEWVSHMIRASIAYGEWKEFRRK